MSAGEARAIALLERLEQALYDPAICAAFMDAHATGDDHETQARIAILIDFILFNTRTVN